MAEIKYVKAGNFKREASIEPNMFPIRNIPRECMQVIFTGTIAEAKSVFSGSPSWGISIEAEGVEIRYEDFTRFSVPIYYADINNNAVAVGMTQLNDLEQLIETIYGGVNNE